MMEPKDQQQQPGEGQATWYDSLGLSDEYKGLAQVKNFKDANDMFKSYKNLESLTGVDKNEIIRIPKAKEGETPDYSEVFKALGRPDTAEGYALPDTEFAKAAQSKLFELNLTKAQAQGLMDWFGSYQQSYQDAAKEELERQSKETLEKAKQNLQKDWGAKYDEYLEIAKQGVASANKEFGLDTDALDKIGDAVGIDLAAKLFYALGKESAKDGSLNVQNYISKTGNESPEVAKYKLAEMYADPETAKKISSGDKKTFDELNRLNAIVAKSSFVGGNN